jgi:hypothetical protein
MGVTAGRGGASAGWPLDALQAAIARAQEVGADVVQARRSADEIRRALVQVQRVCRDAERAAARALALLAGGPAS